MNYRSLLVLLGHDPHCTPRTEVAIRLAQKYDCHLVGLAPTDLVDLPSVPSAAASLAECAAIVWDALRDQAERAADRFRDACHAAGLKSFEAVIDECDRVDSLVRHAHCSDLAVLSQADPASETHAADRDLVEKAILFSARPTLLVPYAGFVDNIGRRVMVSWDDSREAASAVADALPMLRLATHVQVVCWHEPDVGHHESVRSRLDALKKWLMWHGVSAEVRIEPKSRGIADAMLSHAADFDADLIVMGAYGHSRLAERVLGGATRGLLASMTVPVLMSH